MRLALIASLVLAMPLAAAQPKDPPKAEGKDAAKAMKAMPPQPVKVAAAKLGPAADEAGAVGNLRADEAITVRPEIAGRVVEMPFREGERVKRGARLVLLESSDLRAVLDASAAQLKLDTQRHERNEDLFKKGFISPQALDESRSTLARSRAKLAEDQAKLAKAEVRAPFDGVLGLRQVSEGAFVAAGTDIVRLEKIDVLKLDFRVPEAYAARLRAGQPVRLTVDAWSGEAFSGAVYAIEPGVDEQTRTVQLRARVANPGLKLRPGMFARVSVQVGSRERAVWVPEAAIVPRGQDSYVFKVAEGKAALVKVRIGSRRVGEAEIAEGVAAGDLVITEGNQRVQPGAAVAVMGDGPPKAPAAAPAGGAAPAKPGG